MDNLVKTLTALAHDLGPLYEALEMSDGTRPKPHIVVALVLSEIAEHTGSEVLKRDCEAVAADLTLVAEGIDQGATMADVLRAFGHLA